jgi:hypothetical protein
MHTRPARSASGSRARRTGGACELDPLGSLVRARMQQASCRLMGRGEDAAELWFSPLTGHYFAVPERMPSRGAALEVLLQAGLAMSAVEDDGRAP